ncbi:MAG: RluA family pseudouridine synthase [Elusimicrobia bacterium]|nr:RluA family pseudouridine synthase [Elusimicrobiota bacterium]
MMSVAILYQDERLLAVDKPSGVLVVPGRGGGSAAPLAATLGETLGLRLFVVHRLDRDTSGVLLFAKDAGTHRALCAKFESREARKTYLAAVAGKWGKPRLLEEPIRQFGSGRSGVSLDGKPSATEVREVDGFGERASLVEASPKTGRRHQVRVHLYAAGHPVLGDPLYGKPGEWSKRAPRLMLHASRLSFELDGKPFAAQAPMPPDFTMFLSELRKS